MEKASRQNNYHYNKKLQPFANKLRHHGTHAEAAMWKFLLCQRQMCGYQFRRQRPVLNYIADFMCFDLMLIIEVDGSSHDSAKAIQRDQQRDKILKEIGFTTLRFSNWEVLHRRSGVSEIIVGWIEEHAVYPPPGPRRRGNRSGRRRASSEKQLPEKEADEDKAENVHEE